VLTGWFAEFSALEHAGPRAAVEYSSGAAAFAGATYDPTAHYRAVAVFDFHVAQGLTPARLREISQHQVGLLAREFEALDIAPDVAHIEPMPTERRGGFLAIRSSRAGELSHALRERGVLTDFRGDMLRLGPAPYLADAQLHEAIEQLGQLAKVS
jgi:kynureninase